LNAALNAARSVPLFASAAQGPRLGCYPQEFVEHRPLNREDVVGIDRPVAVLQLTDEGSGLTKT
jgi:hypothetical protein